MDRLPRSILLLSVGASLGASAYACGSSNGDSEPGGPKDASVEGASQGSNGDASGGDGGASSDASADAGPVTPPFGDRNLGLHEPYPASLRIQNGGRLYDLTAPPTASQHAAVGDGVTDDTAAFQDAFDFLKQKLLDVTGVPGAKPANVPNGEAARDADSFWLYLPDGTYLVSDTLIYRGQGLQQLYQATYPSPYPFGTPWFDLTRVRLVGASREGTIIKLADHAGGFGDATKPKPVVTFQHPDTTFNDWNADNLMKNITVDVGSGNPGAVGILAQGANTSGIRNVTVRSGDGSGAYGIWLPIGPVQGCYHDITVSGFDYGVAQTEGSGTNGCFENLTLNDQSKAGILVTRAGFVVRNLLASETAAKVPAALMNDQGAQLLVIDSSLDGAGGPAILVPSTSEDSVFVRNIVTSGYAGAVSFGDGGVTGATVDEYSSAVETLFDGGAEDGGAARSLNLPVEQVPLAVWGDPSTDWASVESYRPDGATGQAADTAAAQAALASGKPVVIFPAATYATNPLTVPASVARIDLLDANLTAGGEFDVTEASPTPLVIENGSGIHFSVVQKAQRDVVVRQGSNLTSNPMNLPVKIFVENGGAGYDPDFVPSNGTVWARGLDIEYRTGQQLLASGGSLWIMGYKTEGNATILAAHGGSKVEVLSGYSFLYQVPTAPMIVNDESSVTFIAAEDGSGAHFDPVVSETQVLAGGSDGGVTRTAPFSSFPGWVGQSADQCLVPLYVGRPR